MRSENWSNASTGRWTNRTFDALVSSRVVVEVIEELLVAGSHGISRCRFVGTHTGEFQGRTPTGKKVSVAVIHIDRFQGDTVVGHRAQMDMHGLLAQLDDD
jgi:predicted ester cyclase